MKKINIMLGIVLLATSGLVGISALAAQPSERSRVESSSLVAQPSELILDGALDSDADVLLEEITYKYKCVCTSIDNPDASITSEISFSKSDIPNGKKAGDFAEELCKETEDAKAFGGWSCTTVNHN